MVDNETLIDPELARGFALEVVQKLRGAGFEALWAGGCVRDQWLGKTPKDYDVATNARPEQIRQLFGMRRTLAIGAAFGVITVLGTKAAGQIEVATFRHDTSYSDGRHPDSVVFSTAEEDAQRRDFTINGLFYDPLAKRVIDYVGGEDDLKAGVIRAIRNPRERFTEDKLRMLRAVRFAATFGFQLETTTRDAIREQAHEIVIVSAERIAAEMRRMLVHSARARAVELLYDTQLLDVVMPEAKVLTPESDESPGAAAGDMWRWTLALLDRLPAPSFALALAAGLLALEQHYQEDIVAQVGGRWRLSRDEIGRATWLLESYRHILQASSDTWPKVQRLLVQAGAAELIALTKAYAEVHPGQSLAGVEFCEQKLQLPGEQLNPPPLLTGGHLKVAGWRPGPNFKDVLERVRDAQLQGNIQNFQEALALAEQLRQR